MEGSAEVNARMGTLSEAVGAHVRSFRAERKMALRQVAEKAGISVSYLSEIERGGPRIGLDVAQRIAAALDVGLTDLLAKAPTGSWEPCPRCHGRGSVWVPFG